MSRSIAAKAQAFKKLHQGPDIFLMPNAWNAGSARLLAAAGFAAIGTTSAGIAFSLGRPRATTVSATARTAVLYSDRSEVRVTFQLRDAAGTTDVDDDLLSVSLAVTSRPPPPPPPSSSLPSTSTPTVSASATCYMVYALRAGGIGECALTLPESFFGASVASALRANPPVRT